MVFEELVEKPNGARPVWADLAIKTPASPDYGSIEDYELSNRLLLKIITITNAQK